MLHPVSIKIIIKKCTNRIKLWKHASRNIIDIYDVSKICTYIIDNSLYKNEVTNICNSYNSSIIELVII